MPKLANNEFIEIVIGNESFTDNPVQMSLNSAAK